MTAAGSDERVPVPTIAYRWWRNGPSGDGVRGDGPPLANVLEATARLDGRLLTLWVRGRLLRRDGVTSRVQRSVKVDLWFNQPDWLDAVAKDAAARFMVALPARSPK